MSKFIRQPYAITFIGTFLSIILAILSPYFTGNDQGSFIIGLIGSSIALLLEILVTLHSSEGKTLQNISDTETKIVQTISATGVEITKNLNLKTEMHKLSEEEMNLLKFILKNYPSAKNHRNILLSEIAKVAIKSCADQIKDIINGEATTLEGERLSFSRSAMKPVKSIRSYVMAEPNYWKEFGGVFSQSLSTFKKDNKGVEIVRLWIINDHDHVASEYHTVIASENESGIDIKIGYTKTLIRAPFSNEFHIIKSEYGNFLVIITSTQDGFSKLRRTETIHTKPEIIFEYESKLEEFMSNPTLSTFSTFNDHHNPNKPSN